MDPRHAEIGCALEYLSRGWHREGCVVRHRERPGPAVEELDRRGTCIDLGAQRGEGDVGEAVGELEPQLRLGVHEGLGAGEGLGGTAFDEVAREREGSTRKSDQGDLALADDDAHGLKDVGKVCLGLERPQAL